MRKYRRPPRPDSPFPFKVIFLVAVLVLIYFLYLFTEPHIRLYRIRRHTDVWFRHP